LTINLSLSKRAHIKRKDVKGMKFRERYDGKEVIVALCFILPNMIGLAIFYFIPLVQNVFYSFTDWGQFGGYTFSGLANFKKIFSDREALGALSNTLIYTVFTVPITMFLSMIIAALLNSKIKLVGLYRTIYFLPAVTMISAIGLIWRWMLDPTYGVVNQLLRRIGINGPDWLTSTPYAMISLIIVGIWSTLGTTIVLYLAGLQGISKSFYEAAEMDGAGTVRKFFQITIPLLSPTMFFNLITSLITALQVYDLIYLMYNSSNPALSSVQSLAYLFYKYGFILNEKGYSAAIGVLLLVLTLMITIVNFAFQKKWVHYE
jgi:multiple sugar transport system permease protein